jgi:hypothetical protein
MAAPVIAFYARDVIERSVIISPNRDSGDDRPR